MRAGPDDTGARGALAPPGLPDLPISPHTNLVTARGLAQLQARQQDAALRLDELERGDELTRDYLTRHLRWLQARIDSAVLVGPRLEGRDRAGFGAQVELRHADGRCERLRIVGEDEADAEHGLLSWVSPLARALEGARVGDRVHWRRADEELEVELLAIEFEDEPGARH
jgi:transcription elongation GreA/GreB family factor